MIITAFHTPGFEEHTADTSVAVPLESRHFHVVGYGLSCSFRKAPFSL